MVPTSMFNTYKVFCNLIWHIVMVMCSPQFCTCWPSFWKVVPRNIVASRRANYSAVRWMEEAITHSKRLPPPFLSNTYIMFHNLHMLWWVCIYLSPHHVSAALTGQDFWSYALPFPWSIFLQESSVFLCFPFLWRFFHMNHSSCSAVTFLQPP